VSVEPKKLKSTTFLFERTFTLRMTTQELIVTSTVIITLFAVFLPAINDARRWKASHPPLPIEEFLSCVSWELFKDSEFEARTYRYYNGNKRFARLAEWIEEHRAAIDFTTYSKNPKAPWSPPSSQPVASLGYNIGTEYYVIFRDRSARILGPSELKELRRQWPPDTANEQENRR
jgi:hypothetical protein